MHFVIDAAINIVAPAAVIRNTAIGIAIVAIISVLVGAVVYIAAQSSVPNLFLQN